MTRSNTRNWKFLGIVTSDSSGREYEISINQDGEYGCNCPAWVNKVTRPCKHITQYLGENSQREIERATTRKNVREFRKYKAMQEPDDGRCKKCSFDHDPKAECIT